MQRRQLLLSCAAALALPTAHAQTDAPLLVIGHAGVPRVDVPTLARLYTGRAIEAGQTPVTVFNLAVGHPLRNRFLASGLQTDEQRYRAYWTVRRHVGKGAPPSDVASVVEMVELISQTPGAVGYIDAAAATPGLNVICRL